MRQDRTGLSGPTLLLTALHDNPTAERGRKLAALHSPSTLRIVAPGEPPDIVLYLDSGYVGLSQMPRLWMQMRAWPKARHFLFCESDWPYAMLPGAYPSLVKTLPWARSWSYLPDPDVATRAAALSQTTPDHLFSFLGRTGTHPVRQRLLALDSPQTPCLDLAQAPARLPDFDYQTTYLTLLARSHFVLCPRGFGTASIRLFEAMACGRVPVIIADAWQPPPDIPWHDFSVVVPERDVERIPGILKDIRGDAPAMGECARRVFAANFAPDIFFDRLLAMLTALPCKEGGAALAGRAWRALGWREGYSLAHQVKEQLRAVAGRPS